MATSREERMQQRLRGAQRHEVEDVTFNLVLPGDPEAPALAPEPSPSTAAARATPNTSAKRRRLDTDSATPSAAVAPPQARSLPRSTRSASTKRVAPPTSADPYDIPADDEPTPASLLPPSPVAVPTPARSSRTSSALRPRAAAAAAYDYEQDDDEVESLPPPAPPPPGSAVSRGSGVSVEEVGESPADEPGSGRRRRVRTSSAAASSSSRLQQALRDVPEDASQTTSSPLARRATKSRASDSGTSARPAKGTAGGRRGAARSEPIDEEDELSPEKSTSLLEENSRASPELSSVPPPAKANGETSRRARRDEEEQAQAIGEAEAARALGRKRVRRSLRAPSPDPISPEAEREAEAEAGPPPKRRRKQIQSSPAKQKQGRQRPQKSLRKPAPNPVSSPPAAEEVEEERTATEIVPVTTEKGARSTAPKAQRGGPKSIYKQDKAKAATKGRESRAAPGDASDVKATVAITVQRFANTSRAAAADEDDPRAVDILSTELPFFSRGGVNAVDVLSQACEEVIEQRLNTIDAAVEAAAESSARKELRVKRRAVEAFREELRTRLLDHTILTDSLHALKKRVRAAQREKASLREEILRIRREREQVALHMDAVRIRHEAETREARQRLELSSALHDVDLAVDRGRGGLATGAEATKQLRAAEQMGNLELAIARVADLAGSRGGKGGVLRQVKDFNAFLERAFVALEGKTSGPRV